MIHMFQAHAADLIEPIDERLVRDSVLQELTVAAFELFDPRNSMDAFMDRVAMRLGCAAVCSVNFCGERVELLSASGLSSCSRALPLPSAAEFKAGHCPWPEVQRPDLVLWDIDVSSLEPRKDGGVVHVFIFIPKGANVSARYRGMVERLCRIVCSAIRHRQLYAEVLRSERELFEKKNLFQCIGDGSIEGMMFVPSDGAPLCNALFLRILELPAAPPDVTQAIERLEALLETPLGLTDRMAQLSLAASEMVRRGQGLPLAGPEQGLELRLRDGREFFFFCLPVRSPEGIHFGNCWYLREVTAQKRAERERLSLLEEEREARAVSERARRRLSFLADAGQILISSLDPRRLLENIVRHSIPGLADVCAVDLLGEQGFERCIVAARAGECPEDPLCWTDLEVLPIDLSAPAGPGHAVATGVTEVWPRLSAEILARFGRDDRLSQALSELGLCSAIYAPLIARGRCIGVLSLGITRSGRTYGEDERLLAEDLAARIALAMDNARLFLRAEQAVHVRDEFLSVASHELRTPITSFRLAAQGLYRLVERDKQGRGADPVLRDALDTALRQSERLERLVHRLLDTSRIDIQRLAPVAEAFDLSELVGQVLQDFREEIRAAGAELHLDLKPCAGRWDRSFVEQIFTNLLTNALKFAGGRPIEICAEPAGDWVRLAVRDHGIGIASEDQERIFERFERAVSSKNYSGFGIGLSIVRDLLQSMGGRIRVESEVGRGATFIAEFPRSGGGLA